MHRQTFTGVQLAVDHFNSNVETIRIIDPFRGFERWISGVCLLPFTTVKLEIVQPHSRYEDFNASEKRRSVSNSKSR